MEFESTKKLAELIQSKYQCLLQLRELGVRQNQLITRGELGDLLRLLAAKQHVITALQAVDRQLSPYQQEDPDSRTWSSPEQRAECARLAAECRQLLDEVMQMEKANETQMAERRNDVAAQLTSLHHASEVRGAYAQNQVPRTPQETPAVPGSLGGNRS